MSRIRSNILWAFLAISVLDGMLTAWLGADTGVQVRKNLLLAAVQMGLILAWVHFDSLQRQYHRSRLLTFGIIGLSIIFIPYYLYRSRKPEERRGAFLGLTVFVILSIGAQSVAEALASALVQ